MRTSFLTVKIVCGHCSERQRPKSFELEPRIRDKAVVIEPKSRVEQQRGEKSLQYCRFCTVEFYTNLIVVDESDIGAAS